MPQRQKDYYALLGVMREASVEEIKRAYYESAQRLHPDKNKLAGETELFLEVQQAYEVLSNPQRRSLYDATLPKEEIPKTPIQCKIQYSRPSLVHLPEPQLIYVLLEVGQQQSIEKLPTAPLNICLVLDRSTSMQGEKFEVAKAAAMEILRALRPEDVFSLVTFSDRAEVLFPASYQSDRTRLQSRIQGMQTGGATEIFQGLKAGVQEVRRSLDQKRVNHIILLTDGHTYGDEPASLQLAEEAALQNIGISGFGLGGDWNDIFLDMLAGKTGSNSTYISKPQQIQRLLLEKFNALMNTVAEDAILEAKEVDGIHLNYAFRLQPEGGPIDVQEPLRLGPIHQDTPLNILFEFLIQPSASKAEMVTLLDGTLKVLVAARPIPVPPIRVRMEREASDAPQNDPPPPAILNALSRFALYRMQEQARQEVDAEDYESATRHLKSLASLLLQQGEAGLAKTALLEAEQTEKMRAFSKEGSKEIKYGTRSLLLSTAEMSE
jgi:Ca-activated chloride channel family protein